MVINDNILEIVEYIKNCDKSTTSSDNFVFDLEKYDLADILEAHEVLREEKKGLNNGNQ